MLLYIAYIAVAALLRARRRQISRSDLPPVLAAAVICFRTRMAPPLLPERNTGERSATSIPSADDRE
jgi:hypothetical protein